MSGVTSRADRDWLWFCRGWDVLLALVYLSAMTVLVLSPEEYAARWPQLAGVLWTLNGLLYAFWGRRLLRHRHQSVWYPGICVALFIFTQFADPNTEWMLWVVLVLVFLVARPLIALVMVGTLKVIATFGFLHKLHGWGALGGNWVSVATFLSYSVVEIALVLLATLWLRETRKEDVARARLADELAAARQQERDLELQLEAAVERQRLAAEMRSGLAQGFAGVLALTRAAETELDTDPELAERHLRVATETAQENLAAARTMQTAPSPAVHSLPDALRGQLAGLGERLGCHTEYAQHGVAPKLPRQVEVVLLRSVQESLSTVARHATPDTVYLVVRFGTDRVDIEVADDGAGTNPREPGLTGMISRVTKLGGSATVDSVPGGGTTIRIGVPL
ncbi:hypothetical protein D5S17_01710 [Pseudonocardiaceae bacterium YIM PH 21723]|nr:hypothetical protein D5S17_01710 [Pseudonocardiaceae bacterium YIM PH 21723]